MVMTTMTGCLLLSHLSEDEYLDLVLKCALCSFDQKREIFIDRFFF